MSTMEAGPTSELDELDKRIWEAAEGMRQVLEGLDVDLTPEVLLRELDNQQIFMEQDNRVHSDSSPLPGTLSPEERTRLSEMRRMHPTQRDISEELPYIRG